MKRLLVLFALLAMMAIPASAVSNAYWLVSPLPTIYTINDTTVVYSANMYCNVGTGCSNTNAICINGLGGYAGVTSYTGVSSWNSTYFSGTGPINSYADTTRNTYTYPAGNAWYSCYQTGHDHDINFLDYYYYELWLSDKFAAESTSPTYFQCVDANDNAAISGCNIGLKNDYTGAWSNSTADDDGTFFINTGSNVTISGYATATGYLATERTGLSPFFGGLYELIMWPSDTYCSTPGSCGTVYDPGEGNINLLVLVNDHDTGASIGGAEVKLIEDVGATTYGSTNSAGVATFIVTNKTQFRIVASKSGYTSTSKLHATSAFGPDTVRLELSKSYVTVSPTVTITDASGNVVETLDMRPSNEKDAAMMEKLRDAGPELIDLCIMGIYVFIIMGILAALGLKL